MIANSLACGYSRRLCWLCLHRRGWGCFTTGLQAQLGLIPSLQENTSWTREGQRHFRTCGGRCVCLVGNGHGPHASAMLTHSENAEQICDSEGSEKAARSSGREPDVTINQTKSSGVSEGEKSLWQHELSAFLKGKWKWKSWCHLLFPSQARLGANEQQKRKRANKSNRIETFKKNKNKR